MALSQEQVEARCLEHGYRWPDGVAYEGTKKKYPLICLTCGDNRPKIFNSVRRFGCGACHNLVRGGQNRLTHDQVVAQGLEAKHPAELLEPFKGNKKLKHRYRFFECGHEWEITPSAVQNGKGCGECAHDQGPTYLYLMEHEALNAYKIGVTAIEQNPSLSRIAYHKRHEWSLIFKIRFETRAEALAAEKTEISFWRDQGFPPKATEHDMRDGFGETVSRDLVDADLILRRLSFLPEPSF